LIQIQAPGVLLQKWIGFIILSALVTLPSFVKIDWWMHEKY